MKKIRELAFIASLLVSMVAFGQQSNSFTKDIMPVSPETTQTNKIIRNANATDINVAGVVIEKRVAKYYAPGDLENKSAKEAKRVNHVFLTSYEILNKSELSQECINIINSEFDLANLNHLRKQNERFVIPVTFKGCQFKISLFSWNEIDQLK